MKLLYALPIASALVISLLLFNLWLPRPTPDSEKLGPFECGFDPLGTARLPFSLHFFLVAILFLLFDLEITLLLPLPWAINSSNPLSTALLTLAIITLLTLGLIYEWLQGGLEWAE
uniref:NADH-ubiquinone oxidoreductase chain 3 n=1 Tax=Stenodactylus petrii TaxID=401535 RepID=A0A0A1H9U4_9SAUR|nr:NADH dehydrogenase subunit 3 [Stenodactylus petrii]